VILAIGHIVAPLFNLILSVVLSGVGFFEYLSSFRSFVDFFEFFFLFPIAGIAILAFRWWSYVVFIAVWGWSFYYNYLSWSAYPDHFPLVTLIGFYIVPFLLVGYFMIPAVRAPYFNGRLRWWESKPRYMINTSAKLFENGKEHQCGIINISEGGAFITSNFDPAENTSVDINLKKDGLNLTIKGKIVHFQAVGMGNGTGIGVKFDDDNSKEETQKLRDLISALKLLKVDCIRTKESHWESLVDWLLTLFKSGRGFFPHLPNGNSRKNK